jgi:A/G-specific adenine glycosylase
MALVAETMLQQTQAARVSIPFENFIQRFPSIADLAAADEQEVLAMWQGLGYYRRARNLHAAALLVMERFDGRVPEAVEALRQLPGVGRYTAGAIASIIFQQRHPAVDGNVHRVLARLHCQQSASSSISDVRTWRRAGELVQASERPGVFNEALIELGATVCTPKSPRCDACPISKWCVAHQRGQAGKYPKARSRRKPTQVHHHAVLITRGEGSKSLLVQQRPDRGMWAGMWQPPTIESHRKLSLVEVKAAIDVPLQNMVMRGSFEHVTTHRRITFRVYRAVSDTRIGTWRSVDKALELPMSNAHRKIMKFIEADHELVRSRKRES